MDQNTELLKLINKTEAIRVTLFDGENIGTVPKILLNSFEYFEALFRGTFSDSKTNSIKLPSTYCREMGEFFITVVADVFIPGKKDYSEKQKIWFCVFADEFLLNDKLFDSIYTHFFLEENKNDDDDETIGSRYKMLNEIVLLLVTNKNVSSKVTKLIEDTTSNVRSSFNFRYVFSETLTYSIGRNFVCKILRDMQLKNEISSTKIFKDIISTVLEINHDLTLNRDGIKISLKGMYDLLSTINWINVDQNEYNDLIKLLQELLYPEFKPTKKMISSIKHRKSLVASYNKNQNPKRDTFKYEPSKFPNMEWYSINVKIVNGCGSFFSYTTTEIPFFLEFVLINKRGLYLYPKKEDDKTKNLVISFTMTIETSVYDGDGDDRFIGKKSWRFCKPMNIPIDAKTRVEKISIIIHKLYFLS